MKVLIEKYEKRVDRFEKEIRNQHDIDRVRYIEGKVASLNQVIQDLKQLEK